MSSQRFDLGPVTAYADAVDGGYTGTRDEFRQYMAKLVGDAIDLDKATTSASAWATAAANSAAAAKQSQEAAADIVRTGVFKFTDDSTGITYAIGVENGLIYFEEV